MNRREFLGEAGAAIGAVALGQSMVSNDAFAVENAVERKTKKYEKQGTGRDLDELHGRVANAFNEEVGAILKEKKSLRARHFDMRLFRNSNGSYTLFLNIDLIPVQNGEKPDTIFEARSTVWSGVGAQEKARENYRKTIEPWESRMRGEFSRVTFVTEKSHGGDSTLAHYECMMAGG